MPAIAVKLAALASGIAIIVGAWLNGSQGRPPGTYVEVRFDPPLSYGGAQRYAVVHDLAPKTVVAEVNGEEWTLFGLAPPGTSSGSTSDPTGLFSDMEAEGVELGDPEDLRIISMTAIQE